MCFKTLPWSIITAMLMLVLSPRASSNGFTPATVNDLRLNIVEANTNGEDDIIDLQGNTFTITDIDNVTEGNNGLPSILVDGGNTLTIQNGSIERSSTDEFRFFHVDTDATLILSNLGLDDGFIATAAFPGDCGGAILNRGILTIQDGFLNNNQTDQYGGAICNFGTINEISTTTFQQNIAVQRGGAIYNDGDDGTDALISLILDSTFRGNEATGNDGFGGAIYNGALIDDIIGTTFSNNVGTGSGGAIFLPGDISEGFLSAGTIANIINSTFSGNAANNFSGGAIANNVGAIIQNISNSTFTLNTANNMGGGIYSDTVIQNFDSNIVAENTSGGVGPDIRIAGAGVFVSPPTYNFIGIDTGHTIINGVDSNQVGTAVSPLDPFLGALTNNGGPTQTHALILGSSAIDAGTNILALEFDQRGNGFLRTRGIQTDVGAYEVQVCESDMDGDEICDDVDNCPMFPNPPQNDEDLDGVGNKCDNCPDDENSDQLDDDLDGIGNVCDPCSNDRFNDADGDDICADVDNCPFIANPGDPQLDTDQDGIGNACDSCPANAMQEDTDLDGICDAADRCPGSDDADDGDGDGIADGCDNCALIANNNQYDNDNDGIGNACDTCTDTDGDGFGDPGSITFSGCTTTTPDNCPFKSNPDQLDTDADGMGNACDICPANAMQEDSDLDGICNASDRCPGSDDADDADTDGIPDECDNCSMTANNNQYDNDNDGIGNACDTCTDTDGDGFGDPGSITFSGCTTTTPDNCPFKSNPDQLDTDADGMGNACDICPANAMQEDSDLDGICNAADRCPGFDDADDVDFDGIPDNCDNCPSVLNNNQYDNDNDGSGNVCDTCTDTDADGFGDPGSLTFSGCTTTAPDNCRFKANPDQLDTDLDGMGDACDICPTGPNDEDEDSDGIPDLCDFCPDDPTNSCTGALNDVDGDNVPDNWDNCVDIANPEQEDADADGVGDACDPCTDRDEDGFGDPGFDNTECEGGDEDNCPFFPNPDQDDLDSDDIGDRCDTIPAGVTVIPSAPDGLPLSPIEAGNIASDINSILDQAPAADIPLTGFSSGSDLAASDTWTSSPSSIVDDVVGPRQTDRKSRKRKSSSGCSTSMNENSSLLALLGLTMLLLRPSTRKRS